MNIFILYYKVAPKSLSVMGATYAISRPQCEVLEPKLLFHYFLVVHNVNALWQITQVCSNECSVETIDIAACGAYDGSQAVDAGDGILAEIQIVDVERLSLPFAESDAINLSHVELTFSKIIK